ncbi:Nmad5 family putative nucleotide modification protein [Paraburkholderia sp. RCC_158]|uniref:Nmad5 family putative nucleotide modification protein n=1 Tax=Paraburkholderia sp. RCC_158 TaxID=3239220 RepID=UPI00352337FF
MHGAFDADFKAIKAKLAAHAMVCYRSVVSEAEEKAARKAPAEFLNLTNNFRLCFREQGSSRRRLADEHNIEVKRAMPFRSATTTGFISIEDPELYRIYREIVEERDAVNEKKYALRDSIKRTVYSTTSLRKLIEMWPEVEGFLPANMTAPKPQLPALPVADLNAALKDAGVKVGVIVPAKKTGGLALVAA